MPPRTPMRLPLIWVTSCILACSTAEPGADPTFALGSDGQWAGGQVTVVSRFFRGRTSLPQVRAGDSTLFAVRLTDTSVTVTIPRIPTQSLDITVVDGTVEYPVGSVDVVGFRRRVDIIPGFLFEPYVLTVPPNPNGPTVVGGAATQPRSGGVSLISLRTGLASIRTGVKPPTFGYGVGLSYKPGNLIMRDSTGVVAEWQVLPTMAYVDSIPSVTVTRQIARLNDNVWMNTNGNTTTIIRTGAAGITVFMEDPWRINLFPELDRAVMNGSENDGIPVFAMSTGDTVFRLPLKVLSGAASDGDNQILYTVGGNGAPGPWMIMAINPSTGALIDQGLLPDQIDPAGLALNSSSSLLFIPVLDQACWNAASGCVPELLVIEASTLQLLGRLRASESSFCPSNCNGLADAVVTVDDATGTVFLLSHGEPALLWEFDTMASN